MRRNALSCPRRESSTHAPQALEMLNGDLANRDGQGVCRKAAQRGGHDLAARSRRLAARAGPRPTTRGRRDGNAIPQPGRSRESQAREQFALAMFNLNAFLYVN